MVSGGTLSSAAAAVGQGVFVGRAGELAVLEAAAAAARRGQPQVVLVEGEARRRQVEPAGPVRSRADRRDGAAGRWR